MGCGYYRKKGTDGHYCMLRGDYVDYSTFKELCYVSLAYHSCPDWNDREDKRNTYFNGEGAKRQEGDN